ncbi:MAG: MmgE/PrpD family protein [Clostridiales Family XIII bacterium]|nr:MmgE/PrpD family protein [Clostridiales Family XIII bacterium]
MKNITDKFVDLIYDYKTFPIPNRILFSAKMCVLDYLACVYAGNTIQINETETLIRKLGSKGDAIIIGTGIKSDEMTASLVNALNAHKAELDDGHRLAMLHPGAPIISALLAACSVKDIDGYSFIRGIVVGYEATIRLGQAIQPSHKLQGWHATGTCGVIGAACAIAIATNFNRLQLSSTIAAAATCASGLLEMIDDTSQLKPYNVAHAAMNGYVSAVMGESGFTGPKDSIGGKRGFLSVTTGQYDSSLLYQKDDSYKIEQIYTKPYAACRHSHPAIEAALILANENDIDYMKVTSINIRTYELAIIGHENLTVKSVSEAKMSTPYSVAVALIKRSAGITEYTEKTICDADISSLAAKISIVESRELTNISPDRRAAIVDIQMSSGRVFSKRVDYPLGEPENPMTPTMIEEKFRQLASHFGMDHVNIAHIIDATKNMDTDFVKWKDAICSIKKDKGIFND